MSDDNSTRSDGISNSISLAISILALLISAGGLYWQFLRGPKLRTYQPNVVYVSPSAIGVPVAFTNEGTSADVVVGGSLDFTPQGASKKVIPLFWTAPFEEKRTYDASAADNQKWKIDSVEYVRFSHLPIKAGETEARIFWFDHRTDLGLQPGCYHACGRFITARHSTVPAVEGSEPEDCSFSADFQVADSDLSMIRPRQNAGPMQDDVTVPVTHCP